MLNRKGFQSTAAIVAEVEDTSAFAPEDVDKWLHPSMLFQISDCDRSIQFEFSIRTQDEYRNSLHKLDTMLKYIGQFRDGLVAERDELRKREAVHGSAWDD